MLSHPRMPAERHPVSTRTAGLRHLCAVVLIGAGLQGCTTFSTVEPTNSAETASGPSTGGTRTTRATDMVFCVDEINRYRLGIGLAPLARSEPLEAYAAQSAQIDQAARIPHLHFVQNNGGGIATAETELLLWPSLNLPLILQQGLAQMWAEGPPGDHYQIMTGPYTQVGCGAFSSDVATTVVQAFR
jgi:hypothetical protein